MVQLAYKVSRRYRVPISKFPPWVMSNTPAASWPFGEKMGYLFSMMNTGAELETKQYGEDKLATYFAEVYKGQPSTKHPGWLELVVHSGSAFELIFPCNADTKGDIVRWEYVTDEYDIGFGVQHALEDGLTREHNWVRKRVPSHVQSQKGQISLDKDGVYIVRWDNTYSMFTKKILYYHLEVLTKEIQTQLSVEALESFPPYNY